MIRVLRLLLVPVLLLAWSAGCQEKKDFIPTTPQAPPKEKPTWAPTAPSAPSR